VAGDGTREVLDLALDGIGIEMDRGKEVAPPQGAQFQRPVHEFGGAVEAIASASVLMEEACRWYKSGSQVPVSTFTGRPGVANAAPGPLACAEGHSRRCLIALGDTIGAPSLHL
jgi:hypothetical protein